MICIKDGTSLINMVNWFTDNFMFPTPTIVSAIYKEEVDEDDDPNEICIRFWNVNQNSIPFTITFIGLSYSIEDYLDVHRSPERTKWFANMLVDLFRDMVFCIGEGDDADNYPVYHEADPAQLIRNQDWGYQQINHFVHLIQNNVHYTQD